VEKRVSRRFARSVYQAGEPDRVRQFARSPDLVCIRGMTLWKLTVWSRPARVDLADVARAISRRYGQGICLDTWNAWANTAWTALWDWPAASEAEWSLASHGPNQTSRRVSHLLQQLGRVKCNSSSNKTLASCHGRGLKHATCTRACVDSQQTKSFHCTVGAVISR
jgi:hypothetical protein